MRSKVKTTSNMIAAGCAACVFTLTVTVPLQAQETVLRAGTLVDRSGSVSRSVNVIVEGTKIKSVGPASGARISYDLSRLTLLPGLIDTHVHIANHFGKDGRATSEGEAPEESILYEAENAYAMLLNGFTTAQSIGSRLDVPLRAAMSRGMLPRPRLPTSIAPSTRLRAHRIRSVGSSGRSWPRVLMW